MKKKFSSKAAKRVGAVSLALTMALSTAAYATPSMIYLMGADNKLHGFSTIDLAMSTSGSAIRVAYEKYLNESLTHADGMYVEDLAADGVTTKLVEYDASAAENWEDFIEGAEAVASPSTTYSAVGVDGTETEEEFGVDPDEVTVVEPALTGWTKDVAIRPITLELSSGTADSWDVIGLPSGVTYNAATGVISGTPTESGRFEIEIYALDSTGADIAYVSTVVTVAATVDPNEVTIVAPVLTGWTKDVAISSVTLALSSGTAASWDVVGLPTGVTFNATTGVISGTPTESGEFELDICALDSAGAEIAYTLVNVTVAPAAVDPDEITVTVPTITGWVQNLAINSITATLSSGTAASWEATDLPTGITINSTTGVISGTPTVAGAFSAVVSALDGAGTVIASAAAVGTVAVDPTTVVTRTGSITGTVTAIQGLDPAASALAGAQVSVAGGSATVTSVTTDIDGNYTLEKVPVDAAGAYVVSVALDGYQTTTGSAAAVTSGTATTVDLTLKSSSTNMYSKIPNKVVIDIEAGVVNVLADGNGLDFHPTNFAVPTNVEYFVYEKDDTARLSNLVYENKALEEGDILVVVAEDGTERVYTIHVATATELAEAAVKCVTLSKGATANTIAINGFSMGLSYITSTGPTTIVASTGVYPLDNVAISRAATLTIFIANAEGTTSNASVTGKYKTFTAAEVTAALRPAAAPAAPTVDFADMTITGVSGYDISFDGGNTWVPCTTATKTIDLASVSVAKGIKYRLSETATNVASLVGTVAVTQAAKTTYVVDYLHESIVGYSDATAENDFTTAGTYARTNLYPYTSMTVKIPTATSTMFNIRVAAQGTALASEPQSITLDARGTAPAITVLTITKGRLAGETLISGSTAYEFKIVDDTYGPNAEGVHVVKNWTQCKTSGESIAVAVGKRVFVRTMATTTAFSSNPSTTYHEIVADDIKQSAVGSLTITTGPAVTAPITAATAGKTKVGLTPAANGEKYYISDALVSEVPDTWDTASAIPAGYTLAYTATTTAATSFDYAFKAGVGTYVVAKVVSNKIASAAAVTITTNAIANVIQFNNTNGLEAVIGYKLTTSAGANVTTGMNTLAIIATGSTTSVAITSAAGAALKPTHIILSGASCTLEKEITFVNGVATVTLSDSDLWVETFPARLKDIADASGTFHKVNGFTTLLTDGEYMVNGNILTVVSGSGATVDVVPPTKKNYNLAHMTAPTSADAISVLKGLAEGDSVTFDTDNKVEALSIVKGPFTLSMSAIGAYVNNFTVSLKGNQAVFARKVGNVTTQIVGGNNPALNPILVMADAQSQVDIKPFGTGLEFNVVAGKATVNSNFMVSTNDKLVTTGSATLVVGAGVDLTVIGTSDLAGKLEVNGNLYVAKRGTAVGTLSASAIKVGTAGKVDVTSGTTIKVTNTLQLLTGGQIKIASDGSIVVGKTNPSPAGYLTTTSGTSFVVSGTAVGVSMASLGIVITGGAAEGKTAATGTTTPAILTLDATKEYIVETLATPSPEGTVSFEAK